jgi:pimeloyl-ACP methyl ester carboxylesterase
VEQRTIPLGEHPARLWTGGKGDAIVLLHGGWAGAEAYWSTITDDLERSHLVIAPELPGIGTVDEPPLPTFGAYAAWLAKLLDALGVERAVVVGNSLGAAVAWRFAGDFPKRCRSLVMVNGYPPPVYPSGVRWLAGRTPFRAMARGNLAQFYGRGAIDLAFHDRSKVPAGIVRSLERFSPADVDRVLDIMLAGEAPSAPPNARTLLVWGETDRTPVFDKQGARKMRQALEDSKLVTIPEAGHLPQVEKPAEFRRALRDFLRG